MRNEYELRCAAMHGCEEKIRVSRLEADRWSNQRHEHRILHENGWYNFDTNKGRCPRHWPKEDSREFPLVTVRCSSDCCNRTTPLFLRGLNPHCDSLTLNDVLIDRGWVVFEGHTLCEDHPLPQVRNIVRVNGKFCAMNTTARRLEDLDKIHNTYKSWHLCEESTRNQRVEHDIHTQFKEGFDAVASI